jgi:hypothetical protein
MSLITTRLFAYSVGGGTGAGMATLLMSQTQEMYPNRTMCMYSVVLSPSAL